MDTLITRTYPCPPVDRDELLRYAGVSQETPEICQLLGDALQEALPVLTYQVCFRAFSLENGFSRSLLAQSADLRQQFSGCQSIIAFAATVGLPLDRLIFRYGKLSPSKALMLQAIGAERIESLCNTFQADLEAHFLSAGQQTTPRFSPGYGDLPLCCQEDIFRVLDCPRAIGLTLNSSFSMSPSKSVTALIGIGHAAAHCAQHSCDICSKTDCLYRRSS